MSDIHRWVQLSPDTIAAMERLSTPPPPRSDMSEQHEATSEQWAQIERTAEDVHGDGCSALLELRARVEALEATQHAHIDTSSLWQPVRSITPLNGDPSKRLPDPQPGKQPRVEALEAQAQKVLDAVRKICPAPADEIAAAAILAAADQVVPESRFGPPENAAAAQREITRANLLAIAAELDGGINNTSQED